MTQYKLVGKHINKTNVEVKIELLTGELRVTALPTQTVPPLVPKSFIAVWIFAPVLSQ